MSDGVDEFLLSSQCNSICLHVSFLSQSSIIVYGHICFSTINLKAGTRYDSPVSSEPMTMPDT